jgi:hypothetical protein
MDAAHAGEDASIHDIDTPLATVSWRSLMPSMFAVDVMWLRKRSIRSSASSIWSRLVA